MTFVRIVGLIAVIANNFLLIYASSLELQKQIVGLFEKNLNAQCYNLITTKSDLFDHNGSIPSNIIVLSEDTKFDSDIHLNTYCNFYLILLPKLKRFEDFIKNSPSFESQNLYPMALIVDEHSNITSVQELFASKYLRHVPNLVVFMPIDNFDEYSVFGNDVIEQFNKNKMTLHLDQFKNNHFSLGVELFNRPRLNLKNQFFGAATFVLPPFTIREKGVEEFGGLEVLIFDTISKLMNFQYNITLIKGTWNGLVQHLHEKKSSFGWAHFFQTESRDKLIDFTQSFDTDNYCFFVSEPEELPKWLSIVMPFTYRTWICIVFTFFACILFIWIYVKFYPNKPEFTFKQGFTYIAENFFDENSNITHQIKNPTIQIFALPFILGAFVITAGYKGSLFSFLTAPLVQEPIDTLQEVVDSPLSVGSIGNVIKGGLHKSPEPLYKAFDAKYKLYKQLNLTMDEAFLKASKRELITYENRQMLEYRKRRDFTDKFGVSKMHIARECSKPFAICFGLPKNSIFTEPMGKVIFRLKEAGITLKFFRDEMDKVAKVAEKKRGATTEKPEALNLNQLQGMFIVLVLIILFSIAVFGLEIAIVYVKHKKFFNNKINSNNRRNQKPRNLY